MDVRKIALVYKSSKKPRDKLDKRIMQELEELKKQVQEIRELLEKLSVRISSKSV